MFLFLGITTGITKYFIARSKRDFNKALPKMHISEVSITTNKLNSHFDVFKCFLTSADTLRQSAYAGIGHNVIHPIGGVTNDVWNDHLVTAFFLFRHSIELAIKALIKEATDHDVNGHNLKKMWEDHVPDYGNIMPHKISRAFNILNKYGILEDAQLFRYHVDKKNHTLQNLPPITNEDFDVLYDTAWSLHQRILEIAHKRKFPHVS